MKNYLPIPNESEEQQALFEWKERMLGKYPELKLLHHIPNEGKGRCDLMPLDVVANFFTLDGKPNKILSCIYDYQDSGNEIALLLSLSWFSEQHWKNNRTMFLEVSKHFEEGAKKYGENNWQKGIPTHCYIDSAVRHYLKHLRGDTDEPHDRAFVWNILCCIWTCIHKPEMNDYRVEEKLTNQDTCDKITITG